MGKRRRVGTGLGFLFRIGVVLLVLAAAIAVNREIVTLRLAELDTLLARTTVSDEPRITELLGRYELILARIDSGEDSLEAFQKEVQLAALRAATTAPVSSTTSTDETGNDDSRFHAATVTSALTRNALLLLRRTVGKPTNDFGVVADHDEIEQAYLLERGHRWSEAVTAYEGILVEEDLHPMTAATVQLHLGFCYSMLGEYQTATELFEEIIERYPGTAIAIDTGRMIESLNAIVRVASVPGEPNVDGGPSEGETIHPADLTSVTQPTPPRRAVPGLADPPRSTDVPEGYRTDEDADTRRALDAGINAFLTLRNEEAIMKLTRLLEEDSGPPDLLQLEARYYRARAYEELGDFPKAVAAYTLIQRLGTDNDSFVAWSQRAQRRLALIRTFYEDTVVSRDPNGSQVGDTPSTLGEAAREERAGTADRLAALSGDAAPGAPSSLSGDAAPTAPGAPSSLSGDAASNTPAAPAAIDPYLEIIERYSRTLPTVRPRDHQTATLSHDTGGASRIATDTDEADADEADTDEEGEQAPPAPTDSPTADVTAGDTTPRDTSPADTSAGGTVSTAGTGESTPPRNAPARDQRAARFSDAEPSTAPDTSVASSSTPRRDSASTPEPTPSRGSAPASRSTPSPGSAPAPDSVPSSGPASVPDATPHVDAAQAPRSTPEAAAPIATTPTSSGLSPADENATETIAAAPPETAAPREDVSPRSSAVESDETERSGGATRIAADTALPPITHTAPHSTSAAPSAPAPDSEPHQTTRPEPRHSESTAAEPPRREPRRSESTAAEPPRPEPPSAADQSGDSESVAGGTMFGEVVRDENDGVIYILMAYDTALSEDDTLMIFRGTTAGDRRFLGRATSIGRVPPLLIARVRQRHGDAVIQTGDVVEIGP